MSLPTGAGALRQGESDRRIQATGLTGRRTLGALRKKAEEQGWLDPARALPPDEELVSVLRPATPKPAHERSSLEPHRDLIEQWWNEGIQGTTIYAALKRRHGYSGSYSSVRRFVRALAATAPRLTSPLSFAPGEAAQVDFGKGPEIVDVHTGEVFKTWVFVMVLAWSRHQYSELVRDQSIETWLGCHRRSFEHFNGVPSKIIIDNPKCAITKACYYDPQVQRSYADYAEGYGFLISPCPVADPQKKGRVAGLWKMIEHSCRSCGSGDTPIRGTDSAEVSALPRESYTVWAAIGPFTRIWADGPILVVFQPQIMAYALD